MIKKNRIPSISADRVDQSEYDISVSNTKEEKSAIAFLKGKAPVQPFTIRIPLNMYHELRKIAFDYNLKINQIIINLINEYLQKHSKNHYD